MTRDPKNLVSLKFFCLGGEKEGDSHLSSSVGFSFFAAQLGPPHNAPSFPLFLAPSSPYISRLN